MMRPARAKPTRTLQTLSQTESCFDGWLVVVSTQAQTPLEANAGPAPVVTSLQSDGLACGGEVSLTIGGEIGRNLNLYS